MKQLKVLSAVGLLALAGTANAGFSSTITATNDYDFRGITQSDEDPALQASADFATDSGFYVGAWASNIDFGDNFDADIEVDGYVGFTGKLNEGTTWDAGLIYYAYPGESDANSAEIYGSLAWNILKGKVSYSNDWAGTDESSLYLDAAVNVPLGEMFSFQAHVGHSSGDAYGDNEILDYSAGAGMTLGHFNFVLKYVDTDIEEDDGRVIFTVATTLPWK
jgi:uncharacterized protein (TIGR02001 family)